MRKDKFLPVIDFKQGSSNTVINNNVNPVLQRITKNRKKQVLKDLSSLQETLQQSSKRKIENSFLEVKEVKPMKKSASYLNIKKVLNVLNEQQPMIVLHSLNFVKTFSANSKTGKNNDGSKKINQDSYFIETNILNLHEFDIFCVLDGHGNYYSL